MIKAAAANNLTLRNLTGPTAPGAPGANDRDLALDFVKGVLIILVIVGHLIQYILYRDEAFWDSLCFKWIYMFHMPLFMAISGFLVCRTLLRKSLAQAVGDRAMQLLLPVLFWGALLETAKLAVLPRVPDASGYILPLLYDITGTYWFIWAAFVCFLLVKLLLTFDHCSPWSLFVSVVAVGLVPLTFSIFPLIKYTYPFFCLGFSFGQSRDRWTSIRGRCKLLLIASLCTAALACFLSWEKATYVYNNLALVRDMMSAKNVLLMLFGSAAASAIMIELFIQCWRFGRSNRVVRFIAIEMGQSTLVLYLIQGTVFRLMDSIQYAESSEITNRLAEAGILGGAIVLVTLLVRRTVRDIPYLSQLILGASPRAFQPAGRRAPK
ncbi:nodulation factor fucose acetyltransferase NolL [Bradyrhizobium sp. Gha]|uniref:nodulation factor fucose acetyltransferase NolL n=1 Tax=Bradyrhizobium sp. Gha TaxID=1855318 RepID=UPI0008E03373|nr:nodulation factor fucose acetyltransferase NolL [Bradyrhizobium sp. Gha]SFJ63201.1 Fucose 4-O-acetylase [Bradyrhizobium sp. Gha]